MKSESTLGVLHTCLADARRGRGRVLLVGDEPGIGKTHFVEVAVREARTVGFTVAVGACDPVRGHAPRAAARGRSAWCL